MAQPHESASSQLKAKMDRLNQKIESVAVGKRISKGRLANG